MNLNYPLTSLLPHLDWILCDFVYRVESMLDVNVFPVSCVIHRTASMQIDLELVLALDLEKSDKKFSLLYADDYLSI